MLGMYVRRITLTSLHLNTSLQMSGHSGDGPDISLVNFEKPPTEIKERWKVVEKMNMVPQYAFAGDYTGELCLRDVQ